MSPLHKVSENKYIENAHLKVSPWNTQFVNAVIFLLLSSVYRRPKLWIGFEKASGGALNRPFVGTKKKKKTGKKLRMREACYRIFSLTSGTRAHYLNLHAPFFQVHLFLVELSAFPVFSSPVDL